MAQVIITYDITDCRDCPFRSHHRGHGECWHECTHKHSPKSYRNVLWGCQEQYTNTPIWCPILTQLQVTP